jgi:hypothetical protein
MLWEQRMPLLAQVLVLTALLCCCCCCCAVSPAFLQSMSAGELASLVRSVARLQLPLSPMLEDGITHRLDKVSAATRIVCSTHHQLHTPSLTVCPRSMQGRNSDVPSYELPCPGVLHPKQGRLGLMV